MSGLFWTSLFVVVYTYAGYGALLYILIKIKQKMHPAQNSPEDSSALPEVTLFIAAYNEEDFICEKIENSLSLLYPNDKLHIVVVTDGSEDQTPQLVEQYTGVSHFHQPERRGKIAAVNRVMPYVSSPVVIYTDANTLLNKEAAMEIARHFNNPKVGGVAGEKRVHMNEKDTASGAGEGLYWKYESALKQWDSDLYSVVGAAGELFAIRTALHQKVPQDTIIEDFYTTLTIAKKGYRVIYEPKAYAVEGPSASVKEELKRKIRIAAGGIQAIVRLRALLNIFKYGTLSFQYISHRVLRWTITPFALIALLVSNAWILHSGQLFYAVFFAGQLLFYLMAGVGYLLETRQIKRKIFFVPYYFFIMNYAVVAGIIRYIKGAQSVVWERARRA